MSALDRFWWARTIRRARVVDLEFVRAQHSGLSERAAIRRYVRGGFRHGFSLNPLFAEQLVSMQLSDAGRVPALYAYLVNDRERIETSILWDSREYGLAHPESANDPAGPLGHAWRSLSTGASIPFGVPRHRSEISRDALRDLARHAATRPAAAAGDREDRAAKGDVLLWLIAEDERDLALTYRAAFDAQQRLGAALVFGISSARVEAWMPALSAAMACDTDVVLLKDSSHRTALTCRTDVYGRMAPGSRITVRGGGSEVTADSIVALGRSASEVASPLVLDDRGVVVNAGLFRRDDAFMPLLGGHAAQDARGLGAVIDVDAIASPTFSLLVSEEHSPRNATVLTDAWTIITSDAHRSLMTLTIEARQRAMKPLNDLFAPILLRLGGDSSRELERRPVAALVGPRRLRWAIKTAAPAGLGAEWWGDTHFARGLGDALQRLDQHVVIDSFGARDRPTHHLDDVELVLRGPEPIEPHHAALRMMWIISHPDQITTREVARFDRVFAASESWARSAQRTLGPIQPLLQCTDAHRFRPTGATRTGRVVFVGTARGIPRPSVIEPIKAGVEVDVIGPDWTGWIPASSVVASGIANSDLPTLYEGARLVLNDHWPAMQRAGFISNRLFDVVGAGGRAISDDVDGIAELFGGMVRTYRSVPELIDLLRQPDDALFPNDADARRASDRIGAEHSFDARAAALLDSAVELLAQRR